MARHRAMALMACALLALHVLVAGRGVAEPPGVRALDIRVGCTTASAASHAARAGADWRRNASFAVHRPPSAHFLVLRIARLRLPPGATLVVRDAAAALLEFRGSATPDWHAPDVPLYTRPLAAERVRVEYTVPPAIARVAGGCYGVHIDELRYAAQGVARSTPARQRPTGMTTKGHDDHKEASIDALSNTDHVDGGTTSHRDEDDNDAAECAKDDGGETDDDDDDDDDSSSSERVACVRFDAAMFASSRAVARLLVHKDGGSVFCTGWLFGCEGHVLTNHHCVGSAREASATAIEFLAQGRVCNQSCETPMGCPGVVEATSSELVAFSPLDALDFSLLLPRLPRASRLALSATYGFLSVRGGIPQRDERIFIPQHPAGFGKRVALKYGSSYGRVESLRDPGCNARKESLGYKLDTRGGSSGAPVIAYKDQAVVGLHYCGGCLNSAIPAHRIVETLVDMGKLPQCAQTNATQADR